MQFALAIRFTQNDVRIGPRSVQRKNQVDLRDHDFKRGYIFVDFTKAEAVVVNLDPDQRTHEPIEVHVPLANVSYWEPLSPKMARELYPEGPPALTHAGAPAGLAKAGPGRPRKDEPPATPEAA